MVPETYERMMSDYGPFAFAAHMFYYGEPLINRDFPHMVRRAKSLGLFTGLHQICHSSFDVDALVASGLSTC